MPEENDSPVALEERDDAEEENLKARFEEEYDRDDMPAQVQMEITCIRSSC